MTEQNSTWNDINNPEQFLKENGFRTNQLTMTEQELRHRLDKYLTRSISAICKEIGVNPRRIHNWRATDRVKIRNLSEDELARFDRFFNETLPTEKK